MFLNDFEEKSLLLAVDFYADSNVFSFGIFLLLFFVTFEGVGFSFSLLILDCFVFNERFDIIDCLVL